VYSPDTGETVVAVNCNNNISLQHLDGSWSGWVHHSLMGHDSRAVPALFWSGRDPMSYTDDRFYIALPYTDGRWIDLFQVTQANIGNTNGLTWLGSTAFNPPSAGWVTDTACGMSASLDTRSSGTTDWREIFGTEANTTFPHVGFTHDTIWTPPSVAVFHGSTARSYHQSNWMLLFPGTYTFSNWSAALPY
jgi:hypothetical protein